jgi:periplasmic divalent cation tolerance protein
MKDIAIVYALFGDRAAAEIAAVQMVDRRLAACANILANSLSVYHWRGELARAEETPVLFKTAPDRRMALMAALVAAHEYEVPAVSSWEAASTPDYSAWVEGETRA